MATTSASARNTENKNAGTNAALAAGATGAMSGVSAPIFTACAPEDTSFYCRLTRFLNIVKMLLSLVFIFVAVGAVIYFGLKWYRGGR